MRLKKGLRCPESGLGDPCGEGQRRPWAGSLLTLDPSSLRSYPAPVVTSTPAPKAGLPSFLPPAMNPLD